MIAIVFALAIDPSSYSQHHHFNQELLMRRVIDASINENAEDQEYFWSYMQTGEHRETDPYAWRGITCVAGISPQLYFDTGLYSRASDRLDHRERHIVVRRHGLAPELDA